MYCKKSQPIGVVRSGDLKFGLDIKTNDFQFTCARLMWGWGVGGSWCKLLRPGSPEGCQNPTARIFWVACWPKGLSLPHLKAV